jgi:hypothetical protein
MTLNLERRFLEFLGSLPGSEPLDTPGSLPTGYQGKRADFALFQRRLIVEVKTLQDDPSARVQHIIDEYQGRPGFPPFYGTQPLTRILSNLPRTLQDEIRERVAIGITKALERGLGEANRQIRATKTILDAAAAGGLLVVLNDDVPILSPNLIVYRIQKLLKTRRGGAHRYSEIDWVMCILQSHLLRAPNGTWAHPFLLLQGPPSKRSGVVSDFADYIKFQWGYAEGIPMLTADADAALLEDYRLSGRYPR